MRLKLSLTAAPRGGPEQVTAFIFDDRGGVIGRGDDCQWQLHCPDKLISRRHCAVTFEEGAFRVYDASANGVFVNDSSDALGQGNSHRLADGDTLHMGDFVMAASLLDVPAADAAVAAPAEAPSTAGEAASVDAAPSPVSAGPGDPPTASPELQAGTPPTSVRPVTLGHPDEAFSPPAAHIPEDWNLELSGPEDDDSAERTGSVSRLLDALEPATTRALLEGMGIPAEGREDLRIEAPAARALGEVLSACVGTVMSLQAEYAVVERQIAGRAAERVEAPGCVAGFEDPRALLEAILSEADGATLQSVTEDLTKAARQINGRHRRMAEVLVQSVGSVIEQFAPHKCEARVRRRISEAGGGRRTGLVRLWLRIRYWVWPRAECWRRYCSWYEGQGGDAHRALNKLFEKKAAALYARELKPVGQVRSGTESRAQDEDGALSPAAASSGVQG